MSWRNSEERDVQIESEGEMRTLKKALILVGTLMVISGMMLRIVQPTAEAEESIWEEVNETEETYFKEAGQEQDIPVDGPVQEIKTGELDQEPTQAAGPVIEFTYEEAQLLLRVAQAEAGNQGVDGMWLVMSVVLNRVADKDWPDTIKEVIYQTSQFSSVSDGHFDAAEISPEAHEALAKIETGEVAPEIIGFETVDSTENDKYFQEAFVYKDHKFYVKKSE